MSPSGWAVGVTRPGIELGEPRPGPVLTLARADRTPSSWSVSKSLLSGLGLPPPVDAGLEPLLTVFLLFPEALEGESNLDGLVACEVVDDSDDDAEDDGGEGDGDLPPSLSVVDTLDLMLVPTTRSFCVEGEPEFLTESRELSAAEEKELDDDDEPVLNEDEVEREEDLEDSLEDEEPSSVTDWPLPPDIRVTFFSTFLRLLEVVPLLVSPLLLLRV